MTTRRLEFEGSFNFRDLGGWRTADGRATRWGRVFRADSVHLMTDADVARAGDLGLRTLLDLRGDLEVSAGGTGLLAGGAVARYHLPLNDALRPAGIDSPLSFGHADRGPDAMVARYLTILEGSADKVVAAVRTLATPDELPAVFFCSAGKDRTGVLSAVVLGAVGVRDEDVVEDYVLTAERIEQIIGRFARTAGPESLYGRYPPSHFTPHPETMQRVIDHVRSAYGSFAEYLLAKGSSPEELRALEDALVDA